MDRYAQKSLLEDLSGLVEVWSTFRARHGDDASPTFCAGLESCAESLREALARFERLVDADA